MKRLVAIWLTTALLLGCSSCKSHPEKTKFTEYLFDYFDTVTTIVGYAETKAEFDGVFREVEAQLEEYHRLYDIYENYEGINNLCTVNALKEGEHRPVKVDEKLMDLLLYARELYEMTRGRTNIAMGSVLSIWHRYRTEGLKDPLKAVLPPTSALKAASEHMDISDMILDEENGTVFLSDPEMTLDVGAIAKGYATEQIARDLERRGVTGYILNVGGNVRCIGHRPDGEKWSVGIENPDPNDQDSPYLAYLKLADMSLVTSGSYQRYYTVNGKTYHHIIDPDTLMPDTEFRSVSVVCKDSGKADALSTALFTMDYEQGSALISSLKDVEAMWVLPHGEERCSDGFKDYLYRP